MQQIIYFNSKPLYLVSQVSPEIEPYLHQKSTLFIDEFSEQAIKTMIYEMEQPNIYHGVFIYKDVAQLLSAFKQQFRVVLAGGGFIYNKKEEALLIFRKGKWDMPKGKLDEGEVLQQCAVREVKEETGLSNVQLVKPLCITYHTYREEDAILKESHWYLMTAAKETLTPQTEEHIERCDWVPFHLLNNYFHNMHASVKDVVNRGLEEVQNNQ